jgi:metal-responsive CopG/Arc/MetJ family transcriptional regulator
MAAFCGLISRQMSASRLTKKNSQIIVMERITLRLPKQQLELIDKLVVAGEFPSKSEAIRAAVRDLVDTHYEKILNRKERSAVLI